MTLKKAFRYKSMLNSLLSSAIHHRSTRSSENSELEKWHKVFNSLYHERLVLTTALADYHSKYENLLENRDTVSNSISMLALAGKENSVKYRKELSKELSHLEHEIDKIESVEIDFIPKFFFKTISKIMENA